MTLAELREALAPFGVWVLAPPHGLCWSPRLEVVGEGWRPYFEGRWIFTQYGWTWLSYDPWGGLTYQYGRWKVVPGLGWIWVPDLTWGPAWVVWAVGRDTVGWAPMAPDDAQDAAAWPPPYAWSFVYQSGLLYPRLGEIILPAARCATLLHWASPMKTGPSREQAERWSGEVLVPLDLEPAPPPGDSAGRKSDA